MTTENNQKFEFVDYTLEERMLITQLAGVLYSPEQIQAQLREWSRQQEEINQLYKDENKMRTEMNQTNQLSVREKIQENLTSLDALIREKNNDLVASRKQHHLVDKVAYYNGQYAGFQKKVPVTK